MRDTAAEGSTPLRHGASVLPAVTVMGYNEELRDRDAFLGDRVSRRAFMERIDRWRDRLREAGHDPLGDTPTLEIKKKELDAILVTGEPLAAGLLQGVMEEFAQDLASVVRRFLRLKEWRDVTNLVVGGGFRDRRLGEITIGRAALKLMMEGVETKLRPIHCHPDEGGLIGSVQLAPRWVFAGHDAILAVDIGGTNIRAGVVELNLKRARDLSAAHVMAFKAWRHLDDEPTREDAVDQLTQMLRELIARAEKDGVIPGAAVSDSLLMFIRRGAV
jgi:hypothetical protein